MNGISNLEVSVRSPATLLQSKLRASNGNLTCGIVNEMRKIFSMCWKAQGSDDMHTRSTVNIKSLVPTLLGTLLVLACGSARAGWYHVTNYAGHIGKYPIHLSIQKYDRFGSGLNIEGSYYYDKNLSPIPLYGKFGEPGNLSLCEIHGENEFKKIILDGSTTSVDTAGCQFQLTVVGDSANGTWVEKGKRYDVTLEKTGALDDTENFELSGTMEIPFWGHTNGYMLIGAYERTGSGISVKIKVVDKGTRKIIQEIDPSERGCIFGFSMTPIYMNVENRRTVGYEQALLNCYSPRSADLALLILNGTSKKFELAPFE